MAESNRIVETEVCGIQYRVTLFRYDKAFDLGMKIADAVGGPLGDFLAAGLMGKSAALDVESIAGSLRDLPAGIMRAGGSEMIAEIIADTERIDDERQKLSEPAMREKAFGRGNLFELVEVVCKVLELNYGPFLQAIWNKYLQSGTSQMEDPASLE